MSVLDSDIQYNFYPLIVEYIVGEGRASFSDVLKHIEGKVGKEVSGDQVFASLGKLQEYKILKLNEDTTGTFSLQDWKLESEVTRESEDSP